MRFRETNRPDFLIVGAQKAGTTWLWEMLKQHPGTDLPRKKEIHFFGSAEIYRRGRDWYYGHFAHLDSSKVIGEGSTTYLYDHVPYWYNSSGRLEVDHSLPTIPELITKELPNVKIIITLRDPVRRAISGYYHNMREGRVSPLRGLKEVTIRQPRMRILEYGYYARYIKLWSKLVPSERMCILIFEEDVVRSPEKGLRKVYRFLNLDAEFEPEGLRRSVYKKWSWTRAGLYYYADPFSRRLIRGRFGRILDRLDLLSRFVIREQDIEFLASTYLAEKRELESLLNRSLACWSYGI